MAGRFNNALFEQVQSNRVLGRENASVLKDFPSACILRRPSNLRAHRRLGSRLKLR